MGSTLPGPTTHLNWSELACHDVVCTPYPVIWRSDAMRCGRLALLFECVRSACGDLPLVVASGYRTPEHNRAVGGGSRSQHVAGRALDLATPRHLPTRVFHDRLLLLRDACNRGERYVDVDGRMIRVAYMGGLGLYAWGAHIDVRPVQPRGFRVRFWRGHKALMRR